MKRLLSKGIAIAATGNNFASTTAKQPLEVAKECALPSWKSKLKGEGVVILLCRQIFKLGFKFTMNAAKGECPKQFVSASSTAKRPWGC